MKRLPTYVLLLGLIGLSFSLAYPVHNGLSKLAWLFGVSGMALGLLILVWKQNKLRWAVFGVIATLLLPFLLPGRELDQSRLREDYVESLKSYEGSPYYWGGEKPSGIDCSGLPRRALRDALFSQGLKTLNGRAMRLGLEQWWFDTSAKAMAQGYRDFTTPRNIEGRIETLSLVGLKPGDLAVTKSGVHVLVYLGEGKWIQADPSAHKVITLRGDSGQNTWFSLPIGIYRWSPLD